MKFRYALPFAVLLATLPAATFAANAAPAITEARALVQAGKTDDALARLETALRAATGEDKTSLAVELARTQIAAGLLISAQQTADTALREAAPASPLHDALTLLNARLHEANGYLDEALSLYRTLAERTPAIPERAEALDGAVRTATQLNSTDLAERSLNEFTTAFPQDPRSREFLLQLYRLRTRNRDFRGAAETAHRYEAAYPADPAGAALSETWLLSQTGDSKAVLAAFATERKLPAFTLTPQIVSAVFDAARHEPSAAALLAPLANEFAALTGDPQFQVAAVESLPVLGLADQAVTLGQTLLPKLAHTAWEPRLRIALANALWSGPKNAVEAEKLLIAVLADNPANEDAWNLYRTVTSGAFRAEAYNTLLEQTLAKLSAQKNLTLRATAQSQIRYRLVQLAWAAHDASATARQARAFLETDGLSANGPQVIKIFADACFTGLPDAAKTGPEADAARAAFDARFAILLASVETYLTRTVAWGPAMDSLDDSIKARLEPKSLASSLKKFHEMLQRVRSDSLVRASLDLDRMRNASNQTNRINSQAEKLLPRLLDAGGALSLEGGQDIIDILYRARRWDKVVAAGELYFGKNPGATGPLAMVATAIQQLGAPKNEDLSKIITDAVAKAGGAPWPCDDASQIEPPLFAIAEQNRKPADMQARIDALNALQPGNSNVSDYQRRLGLAQIAAGDLSAAKATLLAAAKAAAPVGNDPAILQALATSFPDAAGWVLPMLDTYLANQKRGPQQGSIQLLRAHLLLTGKNDPAGARQALKLAASRPADLTWGPGNLPWQWLDTLLQPVLAAKPGEATPDQIALLSDADTVYPGSRWTSPLMLLQAQAGKSLDFADSLNRLTVAQNPRDSNSLKTVFIPASQQLASLARPELAGLVLRAAVNRFTGVEADLRAQASQALFSLSGKSGFHAAEIDESLAWAPLLKSAASFRNGDPTTAWQLFQTNESLFDKYTDKLPADYLRWVSDRLLQRDDDTSREKAEKILRQWIVANENSKAVPDSEKAQTQLQISDVYFKTLRYDLARSECLSLINRYPGTPEAVEAQFRIGECYLNQKMYTEAAKVFEGMAKSKNKDIASRGEFFLGVLAQQRGDTDDAKARFRNVMDLSPTKEVANAILFRLSQLYGQENRFSDELTLLRSIGIIGSSAKHWHTPGMPLNIVIQDADLGVSRGQSYVPVQVTTTSGDTELVRLESGSAGKGFFRAELPTELGDPKPGDHILQVNGSDVISYDYPDDFKKQFTSIAPPQSGIRLASDAEFRISSTEIKEEEEISFEERLREQRRLAGKQAGLEFRQEFRKGNDLKPGNNIYLQVKDPDRDVSKTADTVNVLVSASSGGRITAKLTETGPHTGVFRGTLPTLEIAANVFASDRSSGNDAVRAIDDNPKTSWEGLNDGLAPKFIVVDLKQSTKLGAFKWSSDALVKDKVPVEYAVQVSDDLIAWKTVAATAKFTGSNDALTRRVAQTSADNVTRAAIDLSGAEGRYVRLFIEKFSGSAPRLAEIEVDDPAGAPLVPSKTGDDTTAVNGLRLTPSDKVTAVYQDETSMLSTDKPRSLTQQLQATYCNAKIGFIAYEFVAVPGRNEPDKFVKQVRRADPGQRVIVSITDYDADLTDKRDKVKFVLRTSDGKETPMEAVETEPFTGVFTKEFDLWSPQHPDGFKLDPGVTLEARYLDEQNTDPGAATLRFAYLEPVTPGPVTVAFIPSSVKTAKDGQQQMVYTPATGAQAGAIKSVAFQPPLTFEIVDPAAARDSFSEITAVLTTSGGSRAEVVCPLSGFADGSPGRGNKKGSLDQALETGRFVGQIFMSLGDKDSPSTSVLELGDTRTLIQRRSPAARQDQQQMANVVPVLNLNGQDIITVTYDAGGHTYTDRARLAVPASVGFTDSNYDKPAAELYIGDKIFVVVHDLTADSSSEADSVDVVLTSPRGEKFTARLLETLSHSGEFSGSFPLVAGEKPVPGDDRMEAWFGDAITLSYTPKGEGAARLEKTIGVVKGTDAKLLVFEKKFATEKVAIESQFRMAESYFELFKNYRALKQDTQANNALSDGLQLLKELHEDYPSKAYEARTDYLLGQFAQELKKYDEAIGYYRRIVTNHSEHPLAPDAQYKLGQCEEDKGDMDAASAAYVTLAYTWPDNPLVANVIVRISEYFYNKKDYPAAAEVAMKFVERFPQHEWAERMLFRAAQCRFKADQFQKAGETFDLLVENYPRGTFRADAMFWAGESYRSAHQLENAFRRYKRVTWDYPESDAAKYARGKLVLPEMVKISDNDVAQ